MFKRGSYSLLVANRALEGLERKISCAARAERGNTSGRRPLFFAPMHPSYVVCHVEDSKDDSDRGRLHPPLRTQVRCGDLVLDSVLNWWGTCRWIW
jgi:hypothetical protein